jgi:hypothetical protein
MRGHNRGVVGKGLGRRRALIAAVIAALVIVPAALVVTQQRAASAATILSILDGTAAVARGTAAFSSASDGDIVNDGDRVQTAERSHALVTFFDGSTLEIEPATTVQIEEAQVAASGAISIRISQTLGRTWASVRHLTRADSKFEVRTPTLTAAVRGTGFITEVLADGTSTVQTTDGIVEVTAQGQSVLVGAGQTTTVQPNAPPSTPGATPAPPNRLRFGMHSPAYLVALDPLGRACGIVLPGPTVLRQIPGCLASEPGTDPQLVDVPNASPGFYRLLVASIAPGGGFTLTASAVDASGALSFNYIASGSGEPGAKFATGIEVAAAANGTLTAGGLGALTALDGSPVRAVLASVTPLVLATGTPDTSLFAPLPSIGYAAGPNISPLPSSVPLATISPLPTLPLPLTTATALPTALPSAIPTLPPTAVPTRLPTLPPTPLPTLPPTALPTLPPTPVPTLPPTPTPLPPTLSGGGASPGGTLPVLGVNWPVGAAVTITWPDNTQVGSADVQADGRFATLIRVPQGALPGQTYKITARAGGLTQTAEVVIVFAPSLTLLNTFPPRAGTSVPYSGSGWPPNSAYTIRIGTTTVAGGTTTAAGTLPANSVIVVPQNTPPGTYTVTATSGVYSASAQLTTQ